MKGFSNLKSAGKDVLLDLTPEKPLKVTKAKELGRQKRQQDLLKKDARNKEVRPRLPEGLRSYAPMCERTNTTTW